MKRRKTLATISHQLSELVQSMGDTPLYFTAGYNNKDPFEVLSEKLTDVVKSHNRIVGYIGLRKVNDDEYKVGVVVYPDADTQRRDEKKGVNYDRVCF